MAFSANKVTLLILAMSSVLLAGCPSGWLAWRDSCYTLLPDKMQWDDAMEVCDRPGSAVAVPNSAQEQDFIWREMKARMIEFGAESVDDLELWIGCLEEDGVLSCLGEEGFHGYENWVEYEPSTLASKCVRMAEKYGGKWGDTGCSVENYAACEMRTTSSHSYCLQTDLSGHFTPQCLLNHVIKNLTTTGVIGCGQACWEEPRCHSFNILGQEAKTRICQFNSASSLEAGGADFKDIENCYFFDL